MARYIRIAVAAEAPDAAVTLLGEARRFESDLGLNPKAILSLQWTLAPSKPVGIVADLEEQRQRLQAGGAS